MREFHRLTFIPLGDHSAELELDGFRLNGVIAYELGQSVDAPLTLKLELRLRSVRTAVPVNDAADELPAFESRQ